MVSPLQHYLAQVQEHLPFGGSRRARILSEIETHLLESWEDEQSRGLLTQEALALALERFGEPALIGQQFARLEIERRLRQGRQCWQRACLFLMPLLLCCVIGLLGPLGYEEPRQVFLRFTDDLGNELAAAHLRLVGIFLVGWLSLGGAARLYDFRYPGDSHDEKLVARDLAQSAVDLSWPGVPAI